MTPSNAQALRPMGLRAGITPGDRQPRLPSVGDHL